MKQNEVIVGKRYVARISGNLTVVEIRRPIDRGTRQRRRLHWQAVNLKTGRDVEIKSAAALRREANDGDVRTYCPNVVTPEVASLVQGLFVAPTLHGYGVLSTHERNKGD